MVKVGKDSVTFVGDVKSHSVGEMLELLAKAGYTTQALNEDQIPNDFIPVVLDERRTDDWFVFRSAWPVNYSRPSWCKNKREVLLFKARAVHCCPQVVLKAVAQMVNKYHLS